jgi:hypothetical protein
VDTNAILLAILLVVATAPTAVSTAEGSPMAAEDDYIPCPEIPLQPTVAKTRGQMATWVYGAGGSYFVEDTALFAVYPVGGEPTQFALSVPEWYALSGPDGSRSTSTYTVYRVDGAVLTGQSLKCATPPVATGTVYGNTVAFFAIDEPGIFFLHLQTEYTPSMFLRPYEIWQGDLGVVTITSPTEVLSVHWQLVF